MSEREKRDNERYGLELPITVHWKDTSGTEQESAGTTKNISSSGALILCSCPIETGCQIDVEIDFPVSIAGITKSRVTARGKVIRDATGPNPVAASGHGIIFDRFSFTKL